MIFIGVGLPYLWTERRTEQSKVGRNSTIKHTNTYRYPTNICPFQEQPHLQSEIRPPPQTPPSRGPAPSVTSCHILLMIYRLTANIFWLLSFFLSDIDVTCSLPLGVESGAILDHQLSATTSQNVLREPRNARLHRNYGNHLQCILLQSLWGGGGNVSPQVHRFALLRGSKGETTTGA